MPVQLNPQLIGSGVGEPVPLNDLGALYTRAAAFRDSNASYEAGQEKTRQNKIMEDAYKAATDENGNVDNAKLQSFLAQGGVGTAIPAIQKAGMELRKGQAEIGHKDVETQQKKQTMVTEGLKLVGNTVASLIARPDTDERTVYGEVGKLVNAGAFDAQAQHSGTTPDEYARNLLSTMPVGNPPALKQWLVQQGSIVADASKRLEMSVPKYDEQDQGGVINQGTINQMTGERTPGVNVTKTPTPDSALSAQTIRRGQDMVEQRAQSNLTVNHGVAGLTEEQKAALSDAINSGRLDPNRVNGRTASIYADLALRDPKTDFNKHGADAALMRNPAFQQKTMVASTLPEVMTNMVEAGKKLNFSDLKFAGQAQAWMKGQVNDPDLTEYMTQRNDALMSIAGVMRGVGMTDMAHKAETEVANPNMSPQALDAWLRGQMKSLEPRLKNNARIMHTDAAHNPTPAPAGRPPLDSFFRK